MARMQQALRKLFLISELEFSLQTDTAHILRAIRERIVTVLLRLCAILGVVSVGVGSWAMWQNQNWVGILLGNLALASVLFLALRRKTDYRIRAILLVAIAYFYLFFSLLQEINEFSFSVLFAFVVMTTLLLGQKGGAAAFVLSLLTIFFVNWGISNGLLQFTSRLANLSEPLPTILVVYTDWLFYAGIFFFTIWTYFDGFRIAWERELEATTLLATRARSAATTGYS